MDNKMRRLLAAAVLAAMVLGPAAVATAEDEDESRPPSAQTGAATAIADRSATLTAQVTPRSATTSLRFEYGPTTSYGQSIAAGTIAAGATSRTVTAAIDGLLPGTRYHFRVRASNKNGTATGGDASFTTTSISSGAAPTGASPPGGPDAAPGTPSSSTNQDAGAGDATAAPGPADAPPSAAASEPVLGRSAVVAPLEGTIKVRLPGGRRYTELAAGDSIPVGAVVDARRGAVALTSSLGGGRTQSGEFRGALFQVRQSRSGRGMTDIVLRGGDFGACARAGGRGTRARAASARRRRPPTRRLWARDSGGRFRTHGRNSVATVRGTAWVTTDTCAGTRTSVTRGAVAVRDLRRRKTVLVRARRSYLARGLR